MRNVLKITLFAAATLLGLVETSGALADTILTYAGSGSAARALFPSNDLLDWGQFGPYPTSVANGSVATSTNGINVTVFSPNGSFQRLDEGFGWTGHFQIGDHLLWDLAGAGAVDLDTLVAGIGFETHSNNGGAFTATVSIFDSSHTLLSSLIQAGFGGACGPGCNDAPFFGFQDLSGANIASVSISMTNDASGFGFNQLSILDGPTSVPEPVSLVLLGTGHVGLGLMRRRKAA
jgi:hypothetical protein